MKINQISKTFQLVQLILILILSFSCTKLKLTSNLNYHWIKSDEQSVISYRFQENVKQITASKILSRWVTDFTREELRSWDQAMISNQLVSLNLIPDLAVLDLLVNEHTNRAEFQKAVEQQMKLVYYSTLNLLGYSLVTNKIAHSKWEAAEVRLIFIDKNKPGSRQQAQHILYKLLDARDLENQFIELAIHYSDETNTASRGGDLGYILKEHLIPDIAQLVFSTERKGIIPKVIEVDSGYYLVYVKQPPTGIPFNQLRNKMKLESVKLYNLLLNKVIDENVKKNYKPNAALKTIIINEVNYKIAQIPNDTIMMEIGGVPYDWHKCKNLLIMLSSGADMELDYDDFILKIDNLAEFMFFVEKALDAGLHQTSKFQQQLDSVYQDKLRDYALEIHYDQLTRQAEQLVTEQAVKEYYHNLKQKPTQPKIDKQGVYVYDERGGVIREQLSLQQAAPMIKQELKQKKLLELEHKWLIDAIAKYNVEFSLRGIKYLKQRLSDL